MNNDNARNGNGSPSAPLITIEEAARLSNTSLSTIRRMMARGELEVIYFGHHPRIVTDSLFGRRRKRQG